MRDRPSHPPPVPDVRDLVSLTSLRGLAALGVFCFHVQHHGIWLGSLPLLPTGYAGLTFFFVLSGFVLAWTYRPGRVRRFWWRRAVRIYPTHLVVLAAAAVVPVVPVARSWALAVPHVLLVQAWPPSPDVAFGLNAVAWSLSCEVAFYAAFPVVFWLLLRLPLLGALAVPALGVLVVLALEYVDPVLGGWFFHLPLARLPEFALGVALGGSLRSGVRLPVCPVRVAALLMVGVYAAAALTVDTYPLASQVVVWPAALLVLAAAQRDLATERRGAPGVLAAGWLQYAGRLSFAFYLVHELVLVNLAALGLVPGWVTAVAALVVSVGLAALLHHGVEVPVLRWALGPARPLPVTVATPATAAAPPRADRINGAA